MKNLLLIVFIEFLFSIICNKIFSQSIDKKNIGVFYSSGLFLENYEKNKNDSIIVINNLFGIDDDTSYVSVNVIGINFLEVKIYEKHKFLREKFKTINKKKEGEHIEYYNSGKLKTIYYYHNGKLISPIFGYYENGSLEFIDNVTHIPGKFSIKAMGFQTGYYPNGIIKWDLYRSEIFDTLIVNSYFESGKLKSNIYGVESIQKYMEYFEDGKLKREGNVNEDIQSPVGKWIEYYNNGKVKSIKYFEYVGIVSLCVGEWIYYNEKGIEIKREIKDGSEQYDGSFGRYYLLLLIS